MKKKTTKKHPKAKKAVIKKTKPKIKKALKISKKQKKAKISKTKKISGKATKTQKTSGFVPTLFEEIIVQCSNCSKNMRLIKVPEFDTSGMLCSSCSKGEIELPQE